MDKKVKDYFDKQMSLQKEICKKVRKIYLATIPEIDEEFKNGVPWYGKFYIACLKNSVNVGFQLQALNKMK